MSRLTLEDYYRFKGPGDAQISPDGSFMVYVVQEIEKEKDKTLTNLYYLNLKTYKKRQLTFTGKDKAPSLSPDGSRLAFISGRNDKSQIWILDLSGGEAWPVKTEEAVHGRLHWTPCGTQIIYTAEVFSHNPEEWTPYPGAPDYDNQRLFQLSQELHQDKKDKMEIEKENRVKVITRFSYRFDGVGYYGHLRNQLFITPVPEHAESDFKPQGRQLTFGDYDHNSPAISANGKYIFTISRHSPTADLDQTSDIWIYPIEGGKSQQVYQSPGPIYQLSCSPCGKYLAFTGHDNQAGASTSTKLWILPIEELIHSMESRGEVKPLTIEAAQHVTETIDRPVGGTGSDIGYRVGRHLDWQRERLLFLVSDRGAGQLYSVKPGEKAEILIQDYGKSITSFAVSHELIVYSASTPLKPQELYLYNVEVLQLTHENEALGSIQLGEWENIHYLSEDNTPIEGWVVYPKDFDSSKQYPLVLLIHGGPHASYGPNFMYSAQLFAAEGYVVLYTNPRGSETYGQDFACSIDKNWGEKDFQDIMAGVNAITSKGFIDPSKMFVHGWSYGGYMACWIATQTNQFKAICAGASVTNMLSGYGTSDITLADEYEYGGQPWKDYQHLIAHSPIGHVEKVETPVMLMHGENDLRVAVSQTEEFYIALKRLGKEAIMIRYPNEFHGLARHVHTIDRYQRLISWFNYYRNLD